MHLLIYSALFPLFHQESWVCPGAKDCRAREERMGPQVNLAPLGPHLTTVMQENLVPVDYLVLRDRLDPQVNTSLYCTALCFRMSSDVSSSFIPVQVFWG